MKYGRLMVAGTVLCAALGLGVAAEQQQQRTERTAYRETVVSATPSREGYADVVDRVAPAVVTIRSAKRVRAPQQFPFMDDPMLRQFFGNGGNGMAPRNRRGQGNNNPDRSRMERALGSGVIVTGDGYIVTNHHVVDGAEEIKVDLNDGRTLDAKLIGSDAPSDLALLKINASSLPVLPLGDSDKVRVGDIALAVGNPLGIGETVTMGIISAKGRQTGLSDGTFEDFLQTDASINQGNSGGALINTHGELIGINSQILSPSGGNIGIGFAIPSNMAKNVMDQLRNGGKVRRGKLGVTIQGITPDLATSMNLPSTKGVLVSSVEPNSPAEKAGVKNGDVIVAVNGRPVDDSNTLRNRVAQAGPNADITLRVYRNGRDQDLRAHTEELNVDETAEDRGSKETTTGSKATSASTSTNSKSSSTETKPSGTTGGTSTSGSGTTTTPTTTPAPTQTASVPATLTLLDRTEVFDKASGKKLSSIDAQTVNVKSVSDGWYEIQSWLGNVWIHPDKYVTNSFKLVLLNREKLYSAKEGSEKGQSIAPQTVTSIKRDGTWFLISTYDGDVWVHPQAFTITQN